MELFLIRHGATAWSELGRHTGSTDLPLTDDASPGLLGLRPIVEHHLAGRRFGAVLTSPAERARESARIVLPDYPARPEPLLREFDYGEYEGRRRVDIQRERPGWEIWRDGCPGGEQPADVAQRVDKLLAALSGTGGPVAIVSHGHLSRILTSRVLGLPPQAGVMFASDTASLSILKDHHGQRCVYAWNLRALPHSAASAA